MYVAASILVTLFLGVSAGLGPAEEPEQACLASEGKDCIGAAIGGSSNLLQKAKGPAEAVLATEGDEEVGHKAALTHWCWSCNSRGSWSWGHCKCHRGWTGACCKTRAAPAPTPAPTPAPPSPAEQAVIDDTLREEPVPVNTRHQIYPRPDGTHADFIVVGSGAGGGPLAVRLAEAGYSVLLLEAGKQVSKLITQVPLFNALTSEDPDMAWQYWVSHLSPDDSAASGFEFKGNKHARAKYPSAELFNASRPTYRTCTVAKCEDVPFDKMRLDKVMYPRGSAVGGSTQGNVMIMFMPPDKDWDQVAEETGEMTWGADYMRALYKEIEVNNYAKGFLSQALSLLDWSDPVDQHGYANDGGRKHWLHITALDVSSLLLGSISATATFLKNLLDVKMLSAYLTHLQNGHIFNGADPNSNPKDNGDEGLTITPVGAKDGMRDQVFHRINKARKSSNLPLKLLTECHVKKVVLEGNRAVGVDVAFGANLNSASISYDPARRPVAETTYRARKEVILAAGTFETPKLLQLSGIGPKAGRANGVPNPQVVAVGVGANLRDRYETAVINRYDDAMGITQDCTFLEGTTPEQKARDPCWLRYMSRRLDDKSDTQALNGVYSFSGTLVAHMLRADPELPSSDPPDAMYLGIPAHLEGYRPGWAYSLVPPRVREGTFTWFSLLRQTESTGTVKAVSGNPYEMPDINIGKFSDNAGKDMANAKRVYRHIRSVAKSQVDIGFGREVIPGSSLPQNPTDAELEQHLKTSAWGHHPCCTAAMGKSGAGAVLDGRMRVRSGNGVVDGLRVVDASAFPRLMGFFIMLPTILASEKAAIDIIAEHSQRPARWLCITKVRCYGKFSDWYSSWACGRASAQIQESNGQWGMKQRMPAFKSRTSCHARSCSRCAAVFQYHESAKFLFRTGSSSVGTLSLNTGNDGVGTSSAEGRRSGGEKRFKATGSWKANFEVTYKVVG